jgi:hypothetical protein
MHQPLSDLGVLDRVEAFVAGMEADVPALSNLIV